MVPQTQLNSGLLSHARQMISTGDPGWRSRVFAAIESALSPQHRELLQPFFQAVESRRSLAVAAPSAPEETTDPRRREARLMELALGRYAWLSPWARACALRALDISSPAALEVLRRAARDPDPLVAETAAAGLGAAEVQGTPAIPARYLTIDRVVMLRNVSFFEAIPHEVLAGIATLVAERWAEPRERIIEKGELGDCLYIIESGRLRVHDGDRVLAYLSNPQFFGELSLLDAEPRSASVTAVERSRLSASPRPISIRW